MKPITTCLWFDTEGEEAAALYTSIFPNSRITTTVPYPEGGMRPAGSVMVVAFELNGQPFVALNGGPQFTHSEAVSFQIHCESQEEIDAYWEQLLDGGGEEGPCGWLKDRFGVSWQVSSTRLMELIQDPDTAKAARANEAMMKMRKIVIADIEEAAQA